MLKNIKRIIGGVLFFLTIVALVTLSSYFFSYGTDFSKEYSVYNEVKTLTQLNDVRSKLQEMKIEYVITDKKISLNDYDNITFSLTPNDSNCSIDKNSVMNSFEKIDAEDRNVVKISGELRSNKIKEVFTLDDELICYTKTNNKYYMLDQRWIIAYVPVLLLSGIGLHLLLSKSRKNSEEKGQNDQNENYYEDISSNACSSQNSKGQVEIIEE